MTAHISHAAASRRASRQFQSVVGVIPYIGHIPPRDDKSLFTLSHDPSWYVKRCCICALFSVSLLLVAVATYIFFGPARKWFTDPAEMTTQYRLITVPRRVTPLTSPDCEQNAIVEQCPIVVKSAIREGPWYVCPLRGGPCHMAWAARERCLGPLGSRFRTMQTCRRQCAYKPENCAEGPESCPCSSDYRRVNYVHLQGRGCTRIATGRCLANGTRGFTSKRDCHKHCRGSGSNTSDPSCGVEGLVTRPCTWRDKLYRFYYDIRKRTCLPWNDDICQPDAFSSLELCTDMCY